ncbi:hypothetical protein [Chryseobacterium indoltheticum]|uniref:hypothetical protein n=1 Tax=Chryseobacterium indoltheticum TaxID=254 RepID=UPI003F49519D
MQKVTADYTALANDETVLVDATNNNINITLPTMPVMGTRIFIKRIDSTLSNSVTVIGNIDSSVNVVLPILNCYVFQYYSSDNKWYIISRF